jgi:hypothetical protein
LRDAHGRSTDAEIVRRERLLQLMRSAKRLLRLVAGYVLEAEHRVQAVAG